MSHLVADRNSVSQCWQSDAPSANDTAVSAESSTDNVAALLAATGLESAVQSSVKLPTMQRRVPVSPCPGWKRAMDIVGATIALTILLPLFLCVAAFIKCVSRGPVLYRQRRYGLGGQPFKVWKFRTIEVNNELSHHRSHVADLMSSDRPLEKRDHTLDIILGGKLLRKFGVDELPQLINVLKGEMSLVGPRPDVVPFNEYVAWHRRRFDVLPGITGLWQVCGKNRTTFSTMMRLDLAYVRRRSLALDVTILLLTIPALAWE